MPHLLQDFNKAVIIMAQPDNFVISGNANAKVRKYSAEYRKDPGASIARAVAQHKNLAALLTTLGAEISSIPSTPGLDDQVYTADPGLTLYKPDTNELILIRSNFTNAHRQKEVAAFSKHLEAMAAPGGILEGVKLVIHDMPFKFEGTGDAYYDSYRNVIFAGYTNNPDPKNPGSGRSAIEAHAELEAKTGIRVISLEVKDPCFHIDTSLCPLPSGHMLVYKDGMSEDAYDRLVQEAFIAKGLDPAQYIYHVSANDALDNYATNLLWVNDTVILPEFGADVPPLDPALIKWLENAGYHVEVVEYGELIKAGGALHCTGHEIKKVPQKHTPPVQAPSSPAPQQA
ncbi:MAG: agmatine deiminase family protein [Alphaproteobacteria bacterium]|nr:agmatine deiminase family protein [Alphaproteobacteria bacterium]MCD8566579.1 agmatine deiminase family protein [Alphaproteobacteria bacterium]